MRNRYNHNVPSSLRKRIEKLNDNGADAKTIRDKVMQTLGCKETKAREIYSQIVKGSPTQMALDAGDRGRTEAVVRAKDYFEKVMAEEYENLVQTGSDRHIALTSESFQIKTVDELLEAARVDLRIWEVDRYVINKWDVGCKSKDGTITVKPLHQVKVWLKKNVESAAVKTGIDNFISSVVDYAPVYADSDAFPKTPAQNKCLLELSLPDLHFAKLAWHKEAGEDYDMEIAAGRYLAAVDDLLAKARPFGIRSILLPVGNDFWQSDVDDMTTSGTKVDTEGRWTKSFADGVRLLVTVIDYLQGIAPVDVLVVPGNHDQKKMFYCGEVLSAWYRSTDRVSIDNDPKLRKYVTFGRSLIGFTHGNEERMRSLPLIMAQENPVAWANTDHRYFHLGHLHKKGQMDTVTMDEFNGVRVSILPSLSGTDAWHFRKGYVGNKKAAEAFVFDPVKGQVANLSYSV